MGDMQRRMADMFQPSCILYTSFHHFDRGVGEQSIDNHYLKREIFGRSTVCRFGYETGISTSPTSTASTSAGSISSRKTTFSVILPVRRPFA